jgi:hypothetical protein
VIPRPTQLGCRRPRTRRGVSLADAAAVSSPRELIATRPQPNLAEIVRDTPRDKVTKEKLKRDAIDALDFTEKIVGDLRVLVKAGRLANHLLVDHIVDELSELSSEMEYFGR